MTLAYGRTGLAVELPDDHTDVVEPRDVPGLPDEAAAITAALRAPLGTPALRALAGPDDDVVIVVNDGTRPMPSARVLPPLLAELDHVPRERITLLVATGTHRANTPAELDEMLGPALARGYRVVQSRAAYDRAPGRHVRRPGRQPHPRGAREIALRTRPTFSLNVALN